MNKVLLIALIAVCLLGTMIYERWALNDALRKLLEIKNSGDEEAFIRATDSLYIRMHVSKFARAYMKFNYWIEHDREDRIREIAPVLASMKCGQKEKTVFYMTMLGYSLKKGWKEEAVHYHAVLKKELQDKTDRESAALRQDLRNIETKYLAKMDTDEKAKQQTVTTQK